MKVALFAAAAVVAPFVLLRGRALLRYFSIAAGMWGLLAFLGIVVRAFNVDVDAYLAIVTTGVLQTALLWAIVAFEKEDARWSASRAAFVVFLFYAAAIPLMTRTPPDGDEPFYILITESMVHDHDLDLTNQFHDLAHSATRRPDLKPQLGDNMSRSHLEPFLPLLLSPGYLAGGLEGVLLTMAIFGALLARSTVRLLEEEGCRDSTIRAIFPFVALGPPIVFYAIRVWPEVPGAWFFVEAVRGIRARRTRRWLPALLALVLLKLRFVLIAIVLLARAMRRPRQFVIAAIVLALPLGAAWLLSGSATSAHDPHELIPGAGAAMVRALFGLILDGQQGIMFQAPVYMFGVIALTRWRSMSAGFRIGMSAATLYIFYLIPRAEWHGGWSPALRYIVIFMPVLALGAATLWERIDAGPIAVAAAWTIALVAHGMAFPWRLFHIANGESITGEVLSSIWHSDFSRLFPSYIRMNFAAYVAAVLLVAMLIVFRTGRLASPLVLAALLGGAFVLGRRPGQRIEFEDAHVLHEGGELYPYVFQVQRFLYRGGWILRAGDSLSFLAQRGNSLLQYQAAQGATVQLGTRAYVLPPTGAAYGSTTVEASEDGRVEMRCLAGAVNLDRMDHE